MRPTLALPIDVLRKFDPQVTEDTLRNPPDGKGAFLGRDDDWEPIVARIEGVESRVERETGQPHRKRTKGVPGNDESWVVPNRTDLQQTSPYPRIYVNLPDKHIRAVTEVQVRARFQFDSGPTVVEPDNYDLNHTDGTLNIRRSWIPSGFWDHIEHAGYNVRLKYEYGALGGATDRAGQTETTETTESIAEGDSSPTVDVDSGGRLPPSGTMLLGEEYVRATVDGETDTVTLEDRGLRGTTIKSHDSGTGLHYCPIHVREAVAALAAIELVAFVDKIDEAVGDQFDPSQKRDTWQHEWDSLIETSGGFGAL